MVKTDMDRLDLLTLALMDTIMLSNSFAFHHRCKQTADIIFVNVNKQLTSFFVNVNKQLTSFSYK